MLGAVDSHPKKCLDKQIGSGSAVMQTLYQTIVVKSELSQKAKLSIYQSFYVPTLTYGHKLWVVTNNMRSGIEEMEMGFLCKEAGLSLRYKVQFGCPEGAQSSCSFVS